MTDDAPGDEAVRAVRRVLCKTLTPCPHHEDQAREIVAAVEPRVRAATLREVEAWLEAREVGTARIADFRRTLDFNPEAERPACEHEWVDIRNEVIESGEMCRHCHALRAGNEATGGARS